MDAIETGVRQSRLMNPALFERLTREEYRNLGQMKARQFYKTKAKQDEFVYGWIAAMQHFFGMMADGPKRRVTSVIITIECDKCGAEEVLEFSGRDVTAFVRKFKDKPCPVCQKNDRYVDDEFDQTQFRKE